MSQINRVPKGLQDVLNSQNFGKNPATLGQTVIPTIDVGQFYVSELLDIERQTVTTVIALQTITLEIPTGETWLVHSLSLLLNDIASNTDYGCRIYIDLPRDNVSGDPDAFHLDTFTRDASNLSTADQYQETRELGIWFPSGTTFTLQLLTNPTAAMDMSLAALILRVAS